MLEEGWGEKLKEQKDLRGCYFACCLFGIKKKKERKKKANGKKKKARTVVKRVDFSFLGFRLVFFFPHRTPLKWLDDGCWIFKKKNHQKKIYIYIYWERKLAPDQSEEKRKKTEGEIVFKRMIERM